MIENLKEINNMYKDYKISKGNGKFRKIQAPNENLKEEQKKILKETLSLIPISDCAFGFAKKKNIYVNAEEHLGAKTILEMDLKNFFDTITKQHVYNALVNNRIEKEKAEYISIICTRFGVTPQGAPTSPQLSNIVCKPLDKKLKILSMQYGCKYTRYADDLTFSSDSDDAYNVLQIIKPKVQSVINKYGFTINGTKTHTLNKHRRQSVTGIAINNVLSVPNKETKIFRAKLYNIMQDIEKGNLNTLEELENKYDSINSLQGYANFIYQANKDKCKTYIDKVADIRKKLR